MQIWKWTLAVRDKQTLMLPVGAKVLDVQMQRDTCCLWALCDEAATKEPRSFAVYGTGEPMPDTPRQYVATFQAGAFVFHVFELPPNAELSRRQTA